MRILVSLGFNTATNWGDFTESEEESADGIPFVIKATNYRNRAKLYRWNSIKGKQSNQIQICELHRRDLGSFTIPESTDQALQWKIPEGHLSWLGKAKELIKLTIRNPTQPGYEIQYQVKW